MKIAVTNPPWCENPDKAWGVRAGSRWSFSINKNQKYYPFPFFLSHAASLLKNKTNHEINVTDAITLRIPRKKFLHKIRDSDVVVMESSTVTFEEDVKTARMMKKENPKTKIIFTGPHAKAMYNDYLNSGFADYVCIGECEKTLVELVKSLNKGNPEKVNGIAFKRRGKVIKTPDRNSIKNLDTLPFPAWEEFPMYRYNEPFCKGVPNVQVMTSRGCIYQCPFCMWPQLMYKEWKWRAFSVDYVLGMIDHLQDNYYFNEFYFDDDTFDLRDKNEAFRMYEGFKKKDIQWSTMSHFAPLTTKEIKKMAESGMRAAKFGIESGSERILETTLKKKAISKAMVRRKLKLCKDSGIETHVTFTLGLPNETKRDISKTIDFLFELYSKNLIDTAQFSITTPFPGTKMFEWAKEKGYLKYKDWSDFDGIDCSVVDYPNLKKEDLKRLMRKAAALSSFLYYLKNRERMVSGYFFLKEPFEIIKRFNRVMKMII